MPFAEYKKVTLTINKCQNLEHKDNDHFEDPPLGKI